MKSIKSKVVRGFYSAISLFIRNGHKRANFYRKHNIFGNIGEECMIQKWKIPLYPNLIFLHDNVKIASNVGFITHDVTYSMLNEKYKMSAEDKHFVERIGCIEIMNNVFIGAGSRIMYDVRIGENVVIGAGSIVTKDVPSNSVYAGVPAKKICSFDEFINKAEDYSSRMKEIYGITKLHGVSKELAERMYFTFCESRE